MTAPKVKERIISIRISAAEYDTLHAIYPHYGVRSLSALARRALHGLVQESLESERPLSHRVSGLEERLNAIEFKLNLVAPIE